MKTETITSYRDYVSKLSFQCVVHAGYTKTVFYLVVLKHLKNVSKRFTNGRRGQSRTSCFLSHCIPLTGVSELYGNYEYVSEWHKP